MVGHAKFEEDVLFLGVGKFIEAWDPQVYKEYKSKVLSKEKI